jgi:hypothetical protein
MHYKKQFNICLKCLKHIFNILLKDFLLVIYRMTHPKNYEYVKKWRESNIELNRKRNTMYSKTYYEWNKITRIFRQIDESFFL